MRAGAGAPASSRPIEHIDKATLGRVRAAIRTKS